MGVALTGDWNKIIKKWRDLKTIKDLHRRALKEIGSYLSSIIRQNILLRGRLLDAPFVPNAPLTIKLKGHTSPLIGHTGKLAKSANYTVINDTTIFVGVSREEKGLNIAEMLEYGWVMSTPYGGVRIVPARPYVSPILKSNFVKEEIKKIYFRILSQ